MFAVTPQKVRLYYTQEGNGKHDLILIGGLATNHTIWDSVMPFLLPHYRILRFDNRGAGQSDTPDPLFTISEMANDVTALMDHLGIQNAFVVGHSMGGAMLQTMLTLQPERIKKALICASFAKLPLHARVHIRTSSNLRSAGVPEPLILETVIPWIFGSAFIGSQTRVSEIINVMMTNPWPQSAKGYDAQMEALEHFDLRDRLGGIKVETLVVAGSKDRLTPPFCSKYIQKAIPSSRLATIEKSGHMMLLEYPETLAGMIRDFCKLK